MKTTATRIGRGGRIVLPVEYRRDLGMAEGDRVIVGVEDGEIHVYTLGRGVKRAQEIARRYFPARGRSVVDEFLAERRAEAEAE